MIEGGVEVEGDDGGSIGELDDAAASASSVAAAAAAAAAALAATLRRGSKHGVCCRRRNVAPRWSGGVALARAQGRIAVRERFFSQDELEKKKM